MLKQLLFGVCAMLVLKTAVAQSPVGQRYRDMVFKDIAVDKDQSYHPEAAAKYKKAYLFDLYQPANDDAKARPLIIWMHGGYFKFGSKSAKTARTLARNFAERGYVSVSINYRLSEHNPLFHFDTLVKASFVATQDAKLAVAYFRKNAALYHIDPNKIILGGNSAGGFMALEAAYSTNHEFGRMATMPEAEIDKIGLPRQPVYAVINFWGGIYNLDWLKNAKTPIISVHGNKDGLMPITHKSAPLHGSLDIHNRADALHIPNTLKIYDGYSHELQKHFNPFFEGSHAKRRWIESAQFTSEYLYKMMQK